MVTIRTLLQISGLPSTVSLASQPIHWLPAESDPHERTFMQWPVNREVYRDHVFLKMVQRAIADIANTVSQFEPVVILMDQKHEADARRLLSPSIEVWDISTDDLWCRDSGPTFVINKSGGLAVSHLNFNGWGNKQVHANDGKIARLVAKRLKLPIIDNGLVGEAGGVETDAAGTLIAHESSWVIENRNKGSKAKIEQLLLDALGAQKLIWAPGIKGADITDYHIDSLARFIDPGTVLIQLPEGIDHNDRWSVAAFETYEVLKHTTDARGKKIKLVIVPECASPRNKSADFVASYVNYYVCNGAVIAAQFGDKEADAKARAMLADLYPGREIVTLNVDPLGEIGGGIHCATQQQPMI
ncbi:MAG: agmatine deiminase family protein [Rhodobacteraceae bacterium]|nr:agmatine deiminase family protein [Paracoccaceae bacterium]